MGTFITVRVLTKTIDGQVLRFFFATQHYQTNCTEKAVRETNLKYLKRQPFTGGSRFSEDLQGFVDKFIAAMDKISMRQTITLSPLNWLNGSQMESSQPRRQGCLDQDVRSRGVVFVEEVFGCRY